LRKAGRYKLAAPVSKTGSVTTEVGALPTPSATISIQPSTPTHQYDYCPIPTALAAEPIPAARSAERQNPQQEGSTDTSDATETTTPCDPLPGR
jgi:hypothetical protein